MQTTRYPFQKTEKAIVTSSLLPCYDHFNLGLHVNDELESVLNNRQHLLNTLPEKTKIQWLNQVHGNEVALISHHSLKPIQADASVTRNKHLALAIMTADCLPILLANQTGTEIAAIHAGWRPLADNIILKTLAKMQSKPHELTVWLGPCIGQANFEVGVEVKQAFLGLSVELSRFFVINNNGRYQANLAGIASMLLAKAGIRSIKSADQCTFEQKDTYYSYRREQQTGRMASVIFIK